MKSGTENLLEILYERVITLSNKGEWEEACHAAVAAVDKARAAVSEEEEAADVALVECLEVQGDVLRQIGKLEESRLAYLEALETAMPLGVEPELLARVTASVGVLYDSVDNDQEAIRFYERAIELYARAEMEKSEPVADICNNLGFAYRSIGNFSEAEDLFLKGLDICRHVLGYEHEKTATLCNNLGALYLKAEKSNQAREMNLMALEIRLQLFGATHPDTAQSHANLALSLSQCGEVGEANEHFLAAVKGYEKNIDTESHDYAAVVENYAEFLKISNEGRSADLLVKKAQKKLAQLNC
ncbi:tetratricopeptide repeat protein [Rubritalea spongiae]|uniref:Tetratricopeptide repeat protein n=2 Tax=Rubritalea spongiae TaxID=430797 RepID=A0ABW5E4M8_9BACT